MRLLGLVLLLFASLLHAGQNDKEVNWVTELWPGFTDSEDAMYNQLFSQAFSSQGMTLKVTEVPFQRSILMVDRGDADFAGGVPLEEEGSESHLQAPFPVSSTPIAVFYRRDKFAAEDIDLAMLADSKIVGTHLLGEVLELHNVRKIGRKHLGLRMVIEGRVGFYLDTLQQIQQASDEAENTFDNYRQADYGIKVVGHGDWYMIAANNAKGKAVLSAYIAGTQAIYRAGKVEAIYRQFDLPVPEVLVNYMRDNP